MSQVFKSKEVYKHPKYSLHDKNEIIQVRGVYVSGEYRPPYYNEAGIHITDISSTHCTVSNFREESMDASSTDTVGIYKFDVTDMEFSITRYSTERVNASSDDVVGMYKLDLTDTIWDIQRYEKEYIDSTEDVIGMYNFDVDYAVFNIKRSSWMYGENTPEFSIRLTSLTTEPCVITNFIP